MLPALSPVLSCISWERSMADHDQWPPAPTELGAFARCYYAGLFANTFLISLVGGDVVRAGMAMREARSKAGLLVGSLADRLFDVAGLLIITIGAPSGCLAWLTIKVASYTVACFSRRTPRRRGGRPGCSLPGEAVPYKVRRYPGPFPVGLHAVVRQPHRVLLAVGIGIVLQASPRAPERLLGAACGCICRSGPGLSPGPLAKIASMLPVAWAAWVSASGLVAWLVPVRADRRFGRRPASPSRPSSLSRRPAQRADLSAALHWAWCIA